MSHVSIFWKGKKQIRNVVLNLLLLWIDGMSHVSIFLKKKKANTKCCFEFVALVNWWCLWTFMISFALLARHWRIRGASWVYLCFYHVYVHMNPGKIFIYKFLVVWLLVFMCMTNQEGWRCIWSCCFWSPHYEKEKILKFENVCAFESFQTSLAEKKIIYGLTCK